MCRPDTNRTACRTIACALCHFIAHSLYRSFAYSLCHFAGSSFCYSLAHADRRADSHTHADARYLAIRAVH